MKPLIYFVHYSSKPGGIEVLLPTIINEFKDWKVKVFVIRPPKEKDESVYKDIPVDIEYGSRSTLIALWKFFMLALKNDKAIFHLFNTGPFFLFVLRLTGVKKIIYSIHGTIYWRTVFQKLVRKPFWLLANSNKIVFTSNSAYSGSVFNKKILQSVNVRKIYNPIDLNRFNTSGINKSNKEEMKIIFVGRLAEGKNLFHWIETAEYLMENGIKAVFHVYGAGELQNEIEQRIKKSKYYENIKLDGHVTNIEEIYKKSDLFLFLSEYESFGNVAVESVLCGVPVIAFNIPALEEVFCDFPVFLIDKNKSTAEQVLNKVNQMDELRSAADKASIDFKIRFGAKQHLDQLSNIYRDFE